MSLLLAIDGWRVHLESSLRNLEDAHTGIVAECGSDSEEMQDLMMAIESLRTVVKFGKVDLTGGH